MKIVQRHSTANYGTSWRLFCKLVVLSSLAVDVHAQSPAARHEIGLTLGTLRGGSRTGAGTSLDSNSGLALGANYGIRLLSGETAALYGEFHFLANPLREISSSDRTLTRDFATIYATPGVRLKFLPSRSVSPYFAIGGGYALYEQSFFRIDGAPNPAPRFTHTGAFMFGGGVDVKFWRFVGLRGEIRDFYSGSPAYNSPAIRGGQHNWTVGGGLVLKFR